MTRLTTSSMELNGKPSIILIARSIISKNFREAANQVVLFSPLSDQDRDSVGEMLAGCSFDLIS
jgi:hypothetical protein